MPKIAAVSISPALTTMPSERTLHASLTTGKKIISAISCGLKPAGTGEPSSGSLDCARDAAMSISTPSGSGVARRLLSYL